MRAHLALQESGRRVRSPDGSPLFRPLEFGLDNSRRSPSLLAIAGHESNRRERPFESPSFGRLGVTLVGFEIPAGALWDLADDQSAGDIGHPIRELDARGVGVEAVGVAEVVHRGWAGGLQGGRWRNRVLADGYDNTFPPQGAGAETVEGGIDTRQTPICDVDFG